MDTSSKRPPTVWLTQVLLVICSLGLLLVFLVYLVTLLPHLGEALFVLDALVGCLIIIGVALLFAIAFWGLVKRRTYGRWLSFSLLALQWCLVLVSQLRRASGPYQRYEFDNTAQVVGGVIAKLLIHGLFLTLILRLGFARKVAEFFRNQSDAI
jgi:hypothetical protein